MEKPMKISKYQHARIKNDVTSSCAGCSKPLFRTPKLGNSQAAKLASIAAIENRDGLRKALEGIGKFISGPIRVRNGSHA